MAESKLPYLRTVSGLALLAGLARRGLSIEEMAKYLEINRSTLYKYIKDHKEIHDVIYINRDIADVYVEDALYKRACGYDAVIKKAIKLKHVEYDEMTGKKIREWEDVQYVEETIHIPPDTNAIKFWLMNRRPDEWAERQNVALENEGRETGVILLAPVMEDAPANAPVEADPQA